ncbi:arginine decarboxylase, partial [Microcoleus sp. A003_D6]
VNQAFTGGQDAHPTTRLTLFCGTGILPVLENSPRCCTIVNQAFTGGQDAHPTTRLTLFCGTGILPVLENSPRYY